MPIESSWRILGVRSNVGAGPKALSIGTVGCARVKGTRQVMACGRGPLAADIGRGHWPRPWAAALGRGAAAMGLITVS